MRQGLQNDIGKVVEGELTASMEKFPLFKSPHEGYAVMLEELEEAEKELEVVKYRLQTAWDCIKSNVAPTASIKDVEKYAHLLACEACQVAAMAQKFVKSSEGWK